MRVSLSAGDTAADYTTVDLLEGMGWLAAAGDTWRTITFGAWRVSVMFAHSNTVMTVVGWSKSGDPGRQRRINVPADDAQQVMGAIQDMVNLALLGVLDQHYNWQLEDRAK